MNLRKIYILKDVVSRMGERIVVLDKIFVTFGGS